MSQDRPSYRDFRRRLLAKEHVLGTFVKMPTTHVTEMLGLVGFDFIIIDQEHGSLDKNITDLMVLAARASNVASIVRVAEPTPSAILTVLDVGATGVMVPHVYDAGKAKEIAQACRYRGGVRGFSGTNRAGSYGGIAMDQHIASQDQEVTCIAMIEDAGALDHLDAIAAVPGIDAFFIGRGDLTAALGVERMKEAVQVITAAGRKHNKTMLALVSSREDAKAMRDLGCSAFGFSNDQNLFKSAAAQAKKDYGDPKAW